MWAPGGPAHESSGALEPAPSLEHRSCHYRAIGDTAVECYWFTTSEGFRLPVAVFKPRQSADDVPLVYFGGGPGEESITGEQSLEFWNYWHLDAIPTRDFILFDYRGAKGGSPAWDCRSYAEVSLLGMQLDLDIKAGYDRSNPVLLECFDDWDSYLRSRLSGPYQPGEALQLFSSVHNAGDATGMVSALGYKSWHALGASYGTRVALVAANLDPTLQKLVLDGPYPPGLGGRTESTRVLLDGLERYWKACAEGRICEHGDLAQDPEALFWQAMERLEMQPESLSVDDWHKGGSIALLIDDERLLLAIYGALYSRESRASIIPTLNTVLDDNQPLDSILFEELYNYAFDPHFNSMLYYATECSDNELLDEASFFDVLERAGRLEKYLQWDWHFDVCRTDFFKADPLRLSEPLAVQALVASGEFDPVTPPEYGHHLMGYLPNGLHVEVPYGAHAEFIHSDCGREFVARFLDASPGAPSGALTSSEITTCLKQNHTP